MCGSEVWNLLVIFFLSVYTFTHIYVCLCVCIYIYIYMFSAWCFRQRTCLAQGLVNGYSMRLELTHVLVWMVFIYLCFFCVVHSIRFQAFKIVVDSWKFTIAIHLMKWLTNSYDFRFKWTATSGIRIHPTKTQLSQLVNFKKAIWTWGHFRRMICNKILF